MFAGLDLANCEAQRYDEVYPLKMYSLPRRMFCQGGVNRAFPKRTVESMYETAARLALPSFFGPYCFNTFYSLRFQRARKGNVIKVTYPGIT
jgi:hypothetical protein